MSLYLVIGIVVLDCNWLFLSALKWLLNMSGNFYCGLSHTLGEIQAIELTWALGWYAASGTESLQFTLPFVDMLTYGPI